MFKSKINKFLPYFLAFLAILAFRSWFGFRISNHFGQDMARDLVLTQDKIERGQFLVGYGPKASVGDFLFATQLTISCTCYFL